MTKKISVLMVCLGNICRSPSAEVVFRKKLEERGLQDKFIVDSAGTGDWHIGCPPDPRAIKAAAGRNYDLSSLEGRQVEPADFDKFDYIVAMDQSNLNDLHGLCKKSQRQKVLRLMDFSASFLSEVPDPYYSDDEAFDFMLDLLEEACGNLLDMLVQKHQLA